MSVVNTIKIGDVELFSQPLGFCASTDLLADMLGVIAPGGAQFRFGAAAATEAIGMICKELAGGRLSAYLVRILAGTSMVTRGAGAANILLNSSAALDQAFAGDNAKYAPAAIKLAMEVNYVRFLEGLALIGFDLKAMKMGSSSATSSPSTTATG